MNTFKALENHYKNKDYITYHTDNGRDQLLLFYPNFKSTKIYAVYKTKNSKLFDIGCLEKEYGERVKLVYYDLCDNNYSLIINKVNALDKSAEREKFTIGYDPQTGSHYAPSFVLFFENQKEVIMTYLKDNGYELIKV